jgi:hypothetical protein
LAALTDLSEGAFLDTVLDQLRTGQRHLLVKFTAEALEAMENEWIGEHFCRYPFLY